MKPSTGMKTVILNWKDGENDPFSVFNRAISTHLRACGKNVVVLEVTENNWLAQLAELSVTGIDFVFTWQGLGSAVRVDNNQQSDSCWDLLKTPLICLHGDHPAHYPTNHQLESRYCFHLYADPEFARYSNRHFRRTRSAGVIDIPKLHSEPQLKWPTDDCFVVIKNIVDPVETENYWREQFDRDFFDVHMRAAETLKYKIANEPYVDVHNVLDEFIEENNLELFRPEASSALFHQFHSLLDFYVRNHKSVIALSALREFPVRIYGRGWERYALDSPASHVFQSGLNTANSQALYYSRFGLIDISPSRNMHDRTLRAMANSCSFLSSAYLEDTFSDPSRHASLFYSFLPQDLPEKCSAVIDDPEAHRSTSREFALAYFDRFHYKDFVFKLDLLASTVDRF